jgi:hypothetical protein
LDVRPGLQHAGGMIVITAPTGDFGSQDLCGLRGMVDIIRAEGEGVGAA